VKSRKAGYLAHLAIYDWQVRTCCAKFEHHKFLSNEIIVAVDNKNLNISFTKQDVRFVQYFWGQKCVSAWKIEI